MASPHRRPTVTYQNSHYYLYPQRTIPPTTNHRRSHSSIPEPKVHHRYIRRASITHSFYFLESEDQEHKRSIEAWVEEQQRYQATGGYKRAQGRLDTFPAMEDERDDEDEDEWERRERTGHYRAEHGHGEGSHRRAEDIVYLRAQYEVRREAMRKEAERRQLAGERARAHAELLERERRERKRAVEAWNRYEEGWARLTMNSEPLSFATIPWPMLKSASSVDKINVAAVMLFLMSPAHSHDISRKERLRNAQLRWHPDRFQRYINRVRAHDRVAVEEGVGIIARGLNELMTQEVNHAGLLNE